MVDPTVDPTVDWKVEKMADYLAMQLADQTVYCLAGSTEYLLVDLMGSSLVLLWVVL